MSEDDFGKPENLTPREHSRRFNQGVPRGHLPAHPARLVLIDIQDHIRLIGRTSGEVYEDWNNGETISWCDAEIIEMKRRIVDTLR